MQITINKTGLVLNTGDFPENSREFIFAYGLRQILNDCHSAIKRTDFTHEEGFIDAVNKAVVAKLTALETGELSTRRTPTGGVTPLAKEIRKLATAEVHAAVRKAGKTPKAIENLAEIILAHEEKARKRLTIEAQAVLDSIKARAEAVDLSSLGL